MLLSVRKTIKSSGEDIPFFLAHNAIITCQPRAGRFNDHDCSGQVYLMVSNFAEIKMQNNKLKGKWYKQKIDKRKWRRHEDAPWHTNIELVFATKHGLAYAYHNDYKAEIHGYEKHTNASVEIVKDGLLWVYVEQSVDIKSQQKLHSWAKTAIDNMFDC
jgi:hypothetical protein